MITDATTLARPDALDAPHHGTDEYLSSSMTETHPSSDKPAAAPASDAAGGLAGDVQPSESSADLAEPPSVGISSRVPSSPAQTAAKPSRKVRFLVAAGLLLALLIGGYLAAILLRVETPAGTVVLEYENPEMVGATVSVDGQKKITITRPEDKEPITITVDEGKHSLRVAKGGFETFTKEFEIKSGEKQAIRVRLEPKPEVAKTDPPSDLPTEDPPTGEIPRPAADPVIKPEPLKIKPGEPLSQMALVGRPANLDGVVSWTFDTKQPRGNVNALAHSPDGKMLATGGEDGAIRLWDAKSYELLGVMWGQEGRINDLAWSFGGQYLTSVTTTRDRNKRLCIWDVKHQRLLKTIGTNFRTASVVWSPDGTRVLAGGQNAPPTVWDVSTGEVSLQLDEHGGWVRDVAWSANGKWIAAPAGDDAFILLSNAETGEVKHELEHGSRIYAIAFSPDSQLLASGDDKGNIFLWDVANGTRVHADKGLQHPDSRVYSLAFSPDGSKLASGGSDRHVHIWNVETGQQLPVEQSLPERLDVWNLSWSADGKTLLGVARSQYPNHSRTVVIAWDISAGKTFEPFSSHASGVKGFDASPTGSHVALPTHTTYGAGELCIVDSQFSQLQFFQNAIRHVEFSPDGRFLVGIDVGMKLKLLDATKRERFQQLGRYRRWAWSPDSSFIAANRYGDSAQVDLIDVQSLKVRASIEAEKVKEILSIAISPD